ncbi:thiol-disulfide oxidoreductase DCC family protein [Shewanella acanthi]|uniref:thiol-disulfide oxidoreductase DCC family protein n=1 Tax=Shewanella acanthi TaxID=2864212 RepID=UPI001C65C019|nr:DUF393 domain-containing protein [Shewanella acanthi]QYJ78365.1 DUF393 domain-containing protein [Shewanella acanthi]
MQLRIFFDGQCPLCQAEMRRLKRFDSRGLIALEDINAVDFEQRFSHINKHDAKRVLHGETFEGELLLGLDVSQRAWSLLDRRPWLKLLRLPPIKPIADWGYLLLAKHRYRLSYLLTGKKVCDSDCQL